MENFQNRLTLAKNIKFSASKLNYLLTKTATQGFKIHNKN